MCCLVENSFMFPLHADIFEFIIMQFGIKHGSLKIGKLSISRILDCESIFIFSNHKSHMFPYKVGLLDLHLGSNPRKSWQYVSTSSTKCICLFGLSEQSVKPLVYIGYIYRRKNVLYMVYEK